MESHGKLNAYMHCVMWNQIKYVCLPNQLSYPYSEEDLKSSPHTSWKHLLLAQVLHFIWSSCMAPRFKCLRQIAAGVISFKSHTVHHLAILSLQVWKISMIMCDLVKSP